MQFLVRMQRAATEGIVLFLVLFSAWPFGSVHRYFQWVLLVGVGLLLGLWGARALLERRVLWIACPIVVGLAVLCLLGMIQIFPLDGYWIGWLSPETAKMQEFLLPSPQEMAVAGLENTDTGVRTLSFDAGATRACLLQLVAILALFAVVRNNLRDAGCFHRLAWLCVANGVLLALVGMGQLASSPPNVVLWSFQTEGAVFGPFICRNHFAYHANLCIGLAAGLLLGTRYFLTATHGTRRQRDGGASAWHDVFRDPRVLWLMACLAILFAGLLACLSRGGVLGLIAGCGVAVVLMFTRSATTRWTASAGVIILAVLLVGWLGFDRVSRRWEHLVADVVVEGRPSIWLRTLSLVGRFPILGTGLGTFGLVEPQTRVPGDAPNIVWDHAHNDFLELWVEGGTVQLPVALLVIVLVMRQGMRAFARHGSNGIGRLALGGLAGFVAVVVQSFVDFGLHIPAVALLAAVVAAMLANLAEMPVPADLAEDAPPAAAPPKGFSVAALLQAAALAVVALFLVSAGRRAEQAERYRLAGREVPGPRRVAYLRSAVALAPDRAELHAALADALMQSAEETAIRGQWLAALTPAPGCGGPSVVTALALTHQLPALVRQHGAELREARMHTVLAQSYSPLFLDAQESVLRLNALVVGKNGPEHGMERLLYLSPSDPAPWYATGRMALRRGDRAEACRCWRNALLGSERYLAEILQTVPETLSAAEMLEQVLPPKPAVIFAAVAAMPPGSLTAEDERRYYRAALGLLAESGALRTAEVHLLEARLHVRLDEAAAAHSAYQAALAGRPQSTGWRLEFSEFLHQTGRLAEARQELLLLMNQEPTNQAAKKLYERVLRDVAEHQ